MCKLFYVHNGMSLWSIKNGLPNNREVMKCDMCLTVKEQTPQCAAKCPMGALTLQEVES